MGTDPGLVGCQVAVVGGGASGLMAAITAAATHREAGPDRKSGSFPIPVLLLEKQERVGRKLLTTGNGRCNLSNQDLDLRHYHGGDVRFAQGALRRLPGEETLGLFRRLGLLCRSEADGRIFPYSLQASAVLDLLRLAADRLQVQTELSCAISRLEPDRSGYSLAAADGRQYQARKVILATGGLAAPAMGCDGSGYALMTRLGHHLTSCFPALVQVRTETGFVRGLAGLKVEGSAAVWIENRCRQTAAGEILFTEYGLSGPPLLDLSRTVAQSLSEHPDRPVLIMLDLLPDLSAADLADWLDFRQQSDPGLELADYLTGLVHKKIGQAVTRLCVGRPLNQLCSSLTTEEKLRLAGILKALPVRAIGTRDWTQAQVTAGGLDVREFRPDTLESRLHPGVFAAGEILDIDGDCGGYNLQWAWSSGYLAGRRAMEACLSGRGTADS